MTTWEIAGLICEPRTHTKTQHIIFNLLLVPTALPPFLHFLLTFSPLRLVLLSFHIPHLFSQFSWLQVPNTIALINRGLLT